MKMKLYIIMLFCLMVGMYSCYDDDTTSGRKEVSLLTITAAHDTLTTSFGEELVVNHLKIEQFGEELPLTYEWAYGDLDISGGAVKPYPIKDTLHVVSTDPELKYAFRELGTFALRLKVDNGETTIFKFFILQIDTEFSEGITILSRDDAGKGRLSFMKTLTKEEISGGKVPTFRTDIMEIANPGMELENVTDMIQQGGRLMVSSGSNGRIYNMDSRSFDIETATSFAGKFPGANIQQFVAISAYSNMHVLSENKRAYVYETDVDELLVLDAFDGLEVDAGVSHSKPVFINYGTSTMYAPSTSSGAVNSGTIFTNYDIVNTCFINTYLYVFSTDKNDPLHIYIPRTSASFAKPTAANTVDYQSSQPIGMDRNSMTVGTKVYNCIYYTYNNEIYRWDPGRQLPTTPSITVPTGMEITTIAVDPDQKLLYVGLYESGSAKELKGGLYIYDADSGELLETYDNIADRPVRVIYKERV